MFLVFDYNNKFGIAFSEGEVHFSYGELKQKEQAVAASLPTITLQPNQYINFYYSMNNFDYSKDLSIFCMYRQKKLVIANELVQSLGSEKIFDYLYNFWKGRSFGPQQVTIYGNANYLQWETLTVNTKEELEKQSLIYFENTVGDVLMCQSLFSYALAHPDTKQNIGVGYDYNDNTAKQKAISEGIERLCLHRPIKGKASLLDQDAVDLLQNQGISIPHNNLSSKEYSCQTISSLSTPGESIAILDDALFAHVTYNGLHASSYNTSGIACHINTQDACFAGIQELIERDTFLLCRLLKRGVRPIDPHSCPQDMQDKHTTLSKAKNVTIDLFHFLCDNKLPVVGVIVKDKQQHYLDVVTGVTTEDAIHTALASCSKVATHLSTQEEIIGEELTALSNTMSEHSDFYRTQDTSKLFAWMYTTKPISFDEMNAIHGTTNIKNTLAYYQALGINFWSYTYDNPLHKHFGRTTVKILSDQLLHIWYGKDIPTRIKNHPRLQKFQSQWGVEELTQGLHPLA